MPFRATSRTFAGSFRIAAPADAAFPLFTPLGEKQWIEGWDPEIVYPTGAEMAEGMVWRTRDGDAELVWIVARFDPTAREVSYYRVDAGRSVVRIDVRCRPVGEETTETFVFYMHTALSQAGNDAIAAMTDADYAAKLRSWEEAIAAAIPSRLAD